MTAETARSESGESSESPVAGLPQDFHRRALALARADRTTWAPPIARDAATLILLGRGKTGLEVFLQRRVGTMAFAAGMYVFPGGCVETGDAARDVPWSGNPTFEPFRMPEQAAETARYRSLTVAAARETWEEAGVAIVAGEAGRVPSESTVDLIGWLVESGLTVAGSALLPWSHWVTPEFEPRRFDTRILVAELPGGQRAGERGGESDDSAWISPSAAIDRVRAGRMPMLPPTLDALDRLADFTEVSAVLGHAARQRPRPLLPRPELDSGGNLRWVVVDAYSDQPLGAW